MDKGSESAPARPLVPQAFAPLWRGGKGAGPMMAVIVVVVVVSAATLMDAVSGRSGKLRYAGE